MQGWFSLICNVSGILEWISYCSCHDSSILDCRCRGFVVIPIVLTMSLASSNANAIVFTEIAFILLMSLAFLSADAVVASMILAFVSAYHFFQLPCNSRQQYCSFYSSSHLFKSDSGIPDCRRHWFCKQSCNSEHSSFKYSGTVMCVLMFVVLTAALPAHSLCATMCKGLFVIGLFLNEL